MNGNNALKITELTVNYDKTAVLWDVSLEIPEGKLVGIVGPNGAGKSTLLKASLGIVKPISGKIEFFGQPFKRARHRIAYVPQRNSVDWDFPITAFDLVLMGCYGRLGLIKRPKAADVKEAKKCLEMVGMTAFANRQISELSGGQQQRLFLARALLQNADLYLLDEPFAGVDVATENTLLTLFNELKAKGKTVLIVHHDLSTVDRFFDWVILLNTCLIASGPLTEVFNTENIVRTYGQSHALLDEAARITDKRIKGEG